MKPFGLSTAHLILLPVLVSLSQNTVAAVPNKPDRPNVIIMIADQWRGDALGFLGKEPVKTPNLDNLAKESVVFTNAISNYPVCSPSRAILMTGMYPTKTSVRGNCTSQTGLFGCELPEKILCWSDILSAQGYDLGYIGKWHLDTPYKPYIPTRNNTEQLAWNEWTTPARRHGFNYWLAYGTYDDHMKPMYWSTDVKRDGYQFQDMFGPEYEVNNAIQYITDNKNKNVKDKPFALVVSMNPPHSDYTKCPQKYKDIYKNVDVESMCVFPNIPAKGTQYGKYYRNNIKDYYACMSGVDDQIGRLLKAIKEMGLDDNTIVIFMSDHGNCLGMHDQISKNNMYDEAMRVPLIIRYPQKLRPQTTDMLISEPDITATLLDWTGGLGKVNKNFGGKTYRTLLETGKGKKPESQLYFKMCYYPEETIVKGNTSIEGNQSELRGLRTKQYKFVMEFIKRKLVKCTLFDRLKDPYELHDIATKNPAIVNDLKKETKKQLTALNDWIVPFIL
jgi:arylsulfatase A-like enzyme